MLTPSEGSIKLYKGFEEFGAGFQEPHETYYVNGIAFLQGLVKSDYPMTSGTKIGEVSLNVEPRGDLVFNVASETNEATLVLTTTRQLIVLGNAGSWISLSGIGYRTRGVG